MSRSLWRSGKKLRKFKFSISCQKKTCFADWEASVVSLNFYKRLLDFSQEHIIWDKGVGEFKKFTTSCQIFTIIHSYFLSLLHFCLVHVNLSVEFRNWSWMTNKIVIVICSRVIPFGVHSRYYKKSKQTFNTKFVIQQSTPCRNDMIRTLVITIFLSLQYASSAPNYSRTLS